MVQFYDKMVNIELSNCLTTYGMLLNYKEKSKRLMKQYGILSPTENQVASRSTGSLPKLKVPGGRSKAFSGDGK